MMDPNEIQQIVVRELPDAEVTVEDLTGSSDHFQVIVMARQFEGKSLVEQHQMINRILHAPLEDGRIHALSIKTMVPPQPAAS